MTGDEDRAVSTALTHTLTIAITAVLISTLLLGSGQLLAEQENRAAREQLSEIGSEVVTHINDLDRLDGTGDAVNASVQPTYPDRVVGRAYTLNITNDTSRYPFETDYALAVQSPLLDRPMWYPLQTETDVDASARAKGGDVEICLRRGEISLGRGCS